MFQKILMLLLVSLTTLNFTSHHSPTKQASVIWFKNIESRMDFNRLIITCHRNKNTTHLEGNLYFKQFSTGILCVIYTAEKQKKRADSQELGHFPSIILDTDSASTAWYDDQSRTVEFEIPFRNLVIEQPKE